jgi:hypothetical protein
MNSGPAARLRATMIFASRVVNAPFAHGAARETA